PRILAGRDPTSPGRATQNAAAPLDDRRARLIELISVPAPADPRNAGLRRAGAKAVRVGRQSAPPLPFEVADTKTRAPQLLAGTVSRTALVNRLRAAGAFPPRLGGAAPG